MAVRPLAGSSRRRRCKDVLWLVGRNSGGMGREMRKGKRKRERRGKTDVDHDDFLAFGIPRGTPDEACGAGWRIREVEVALLQ